MEPFLLSDGTIHLDVPREADIDRITACCQDSDIQEWTTMPSPYSRADAERFVTGFVRTGWAQGSDLTWALRTDRQGPLVGMIGLAVQAAGSAELGYWLAPDARGRGLMTRAVGAVIERAFDPVGLGLTRLSWTAYLGNWPSRRVVWRQGFRVEGMVRGYGIQRGARRDSWVGTLLATDPRHPAEPWPLGAPG
jgi:RimJ/RimL family protein N-acetyltransferase